MLHVLQFCIIACIVVLALSSRYKPVVQAVVVSHHAATKIIHVHVDRTHLPHPGKRWQHHAWVLNTPSVILILCLYLSMQAQHV